MFRKSKTQALKDLQRRMQDAAALKADHEAIMQRNRPVEPEPELAAWAVKTKETED